MSEKRPWRRADPCIWDGKPTTIAAVCAHYKTTRPAYQQLVERAIALGGAQCHADVLRWEMGIQQRRKKSGQAAAKLSVCHIKVSPKGG